MAKSKAKSNSKVGIILGIIVLAIIALAIAFFVMNKTGEPTSVMECSVNPEVQFVLDQNNKVIQVNCLNKDAEILTAKVNFVGKSADASAELFVQLSTEAGYIDSNTTGTNVNITIYGDSDIDYSKISEKITNKVNGYFDKLGIIAGATVGTTTEFATALTNAGLKASEIADKTVDEMLNLLDETSTEYANISIDLRNSFFTQLTTLKNTFSNMFSLEDTIENWKKQINQSNLAESLKKALQTQIDAGMKNYKELKNQFDEEVEKIIKELEKNSKTIFEQAKNSLDAKISTTKELLNAHQTAFKNNAEDVKQNIKNYRDSLVKA